MGCLYIKLEKAANLKLVIMIKNSDTIFVGTEDVGLSPFYCIQNKKSYINCTNVYAL